MGFQFTFNLTAKELQSKAHASRSGPLWVNSDETGQQGLNRSQLRSVVVAVSFKYLAGKRRASRRKGGAEAEEKG